jgi:hypothetical protein
MKQLKMKLLNLLNIDLDAVAAIEMSFGTGFIAM